MRQNWSPPPAGVQRSVGLSYWPRSETGFLTCATKTTCFPLNFFSSSLTRRTWIFWKDFSWGTGTKMMMAFLLPPTSISWRTKTTNFDVEQSYLSRRVSLTDEWLWPAWFSSPVTAQKALGSYRNIQNARPHRPESRGLSMLSDVVERECTSQHSATLPYATRTEPCKSYSQDVHVGYKHLKSPISNKLFCSKENLEGTQWLNHHFDSKQK